jgi:hypothetical protein
MTDDAARGLLREYADALTAANGNALELLHGGDVEVCRARMERLSLAWSALTSIPDDLAPLELLAMREAHSDRGCLHCWALSLHARKHPECREKIARWFAARDALAACGRDVP